MDRTLITSFYNGKIRATALLAILCLFASGIVLPSTTPLPLSDTEQQWLNAHPSIRLAVDIDWAPFEYIDNKNQYVGMAAEYIALVAEKLDIEFVVEKEKPWSEVVKAVKSGELDMYSCVVSTIQRREYINFSEPYLSFPMVIVTSDRVAYVNGLDDLRDETVAVVRGYATQDLLEKNHPNLDLYLADNVADALEQLSHGQVHAYIGNIATVTDVIRREGLTNIKISGETPYSYELSMGVRKDWPEFIPILQKALDSISDQERDQIYRKWIKLRYEQSFDYRLLWEILAVVSLFFIVILIWNRRLTGEIKKRNEAEMLLKDTHEKLEKTNQQLVDYVDIIDTYVIISSTDNTGKILSTSEAFRSISGYSEQELIGKSQDIIRHEDMGDAIYDELWRTIGSGETWQGELKNRQKGGGFYWVHTYISPNLDEQGDIIGYTAISEDITSKKRAETLSITDELTSLFNRRHFNNLLPQELIRAEREHKCIALMILDVDHFKPYNDNYGHQQGDKVLQTVSQVLQDLLRRGGDTAFRIGGEEFGIIVSVEKSEDALRIAEKLRKGVEDLKLEHAYSEVSQYLTVSIGIKTHQGGGVKAPTMAWIFRQADDALYLAKGNGRNQVVSADVDQLIDQDTSG